MRWDDIHVQACVSRLPAVLPAEEAVARGLVDPVTIRRAQITGVTVGDEAPADMAGQAARDVLERGGCASADISLILHAAAYYQGHDMWSAASYVQRVAVGNACPAIEVRQSSNGGMAALELAAAHLTATGGTRALLTTADRFCPPGIDRWRSDPGTVLADGATALVLARGDGFARLRSLVSVSEPVLERMHRGDDPPSTAPLAARCPIDLDVTTKAFLHGPDGGRSVKLMAERQRESIELAIGEAGVALGDINRFVLPHFGRRRLDANFLRRFGIDHERTLWSWSRGIGHLGAGDQFAGLARLADLELLQPGDRCLLLGVGGGFTWSAAVLEMTANPPPAVLRRDCSPRVARSATQAMPEQE